MAIATNARSTACRLRRLRRCSHGRSSSPDRENPSGERRLKAIGTTPEGRHAFIVFTWRSERDGAALLRPISARFMHRKEVESYEKAYPDV
ncbi:MAG TPA: BrnT family toxin [Roseiarcus sp.]|nr:BrnT family toxin [Roseiarcus sp.]